MPLDEFWSEEGNVAQEKGLTYNRIYKLIDLEVSVTEEYLRQLGWVVFAANHEPKLLAQIGDNSKTIDMDKLPNMLKATS